MSNTEKERAEFEAWARQCCYDIERADGDVQYTSNLTEQVWMTWKAARRAPVVPVPQGWKITEQMHVAAVKVLHRASGVDGLPQRMVDAMLAAAPQPPEAGNQPSPELATEAAPLMQAEPALRPPLTLAQIQKALGVEVTEGSLPYAIARAIERVIP